MPVLHDSPLRVRTPNPNAIALAPRWLCYLARPMSAEDHKQALSLGFRLGAYHVVRVLGVGGFGVTYQPGMLLPLGTYRIQASAEGYETGTESMSHGASPTVRRMALANSRAHWRFRRRS